MSRLDHVSSSDDLEVEFLTSGGTAGMTRDTVRYGHATPTRASDYGPPFRIRVYDSNDEVLGEWLSAQKMQGGDCASAASVDGPHEEAKHRSSRGARQHGQPSKWSQQVERTKGQRVDQHSPEITNDGHPSIPGVESDLLIKTEINEEAALGMQARVERLEEKLTALKLERDRAFERLSVQRPTQHSDRGESGCERCDSRPAGSISADKACVCDDTRSSGRAPSPPPYSALPTQFPPILPTPPRAAAPPAAPGLCPCELSPGQAAALAEQCGLPG